MSRDQKCFVNFCLVTLENDLKIGMGGSPSTEETAVVFGAQPLYLPSGTYEKPLCWFDSQSEWTRD